MPSPLKGRPDRFSLPAQCGSVAVSGLEMAQNSARLRCSEEEVDGKLKNIMQTAFKACYETGQEFAADGEVPSLVAGADLAVTSTRGQEEEGGGKS
ncbi:hypothetical protein JCM10207_000730 [Rhodosporidiobolus poonsookiae]